MVSQLRIVVILLTALLGCAASTPSIHFLDGRKNNVCKDMKDDALLYFVFVDTRTTSPWTEFDILSTIDSIRATVRWLEQQAGEAGISLKFKTDYYIGDQYTTIQRNLPKSSLQECLNSMGLVDGMRSLSRWGDNVSRTVGESFYIREKEGLPVQKAPTNKERLMAFLRDEYQVESVALLMLVNNYYHSDISLAINTLHNDDVEFAVVSYKYPSEIAHNVLHLYGAADLEESPFRHKKRNLKIASEDFPDDIMTEVYGRPLTDLEMGEFTSYLIGWTDELDGRYEPLLHERFSLFK